MNLTTLLFWLASSLLPLNCAPLRADAPHTEQVQKIDAQLKTMEERLEKIRTKALNDEMDAQPLMFDNWHQYAEKIKASEQDEKQISELKKQINALKALKESLEKESP